MKTLKEKIEVMQAALDGEEIEARKKNCTSDSWAFIPNPDFESWNILDYRIKPTPREFWMVRHNWGVTSSIWDTKEEAERHAESCLDDDETYTLFKVREVKNEPIQA